MARNLISDEEWAFHPGRPRPERTQTPEPLLVLDRIFRIPRNGSPWRDLLEVLGKRSSVYRQFQRCTLDVLWEQIMDALNESRLVPEALQMNNSTVVRFHHQAAGAKGGLRDKVLVAQEVASPPKSTSASTAPACL